MHMSSLNVSSLNVSVPVVYVGVDVAQAQLSVAVAQPAAMAQPAAVAQPEVAPSYVGEVANEEGALAAWVVQMQQQWPQTTLHLVVEPTGGYEQPLVRLVRQAGWPVSVVNPLQVRQWARGQGRRSKSDRQDALLLAGYASQSQPSAQEPLPEAVEALAELERRRDDLCGLIRQEENRHAQSRYRRLPPAVAQSLQRTLEMLRQELAAVEQAIAEHVACQAELAEERRLLLSVPGVGQRGVHSLLVLLHRFVAHTAGQGDDKALTAFVGLDPQLHESGKSVRQRPTISKMGDCRARSLLYLGALGGVRGHNPLRTFYQALVARGKAKKLALVAAARKLLIWAWAVFRSHTPFDPSRHAQAPT